MTEIIVLGMGLFFALSLQGLFYFLLLHMAADYFNTLYKQAGLNRRVEMKGAQLFQDVTSGNSGRVEVKRKTTRADVQQARDAKDTPKINALDYVRQKN